MSDTQSFPFEVTGKGKDLWKGAYSAQEKFTQLDVRSVVEYARLRGVRVSEADRTSKTFPVTI